MSKTVEEEIYLTDTTRNNSPPTLISITKARREISRQLQTRICGNPHTHMTMVTHTLFGTIQTNSIDTTTREEEKVTLVMERME